MPRSHKMLDTMELPPVHRRLFRIILRAQLISYDELCIEAVDLPDDLPATPEAIKNALADMIESGLVQASDSASGVMYRIQLGQSSDNPPTTASIGHNEAASGSIWDQLDNSPPEKRP